MARQYGFGGQGFALPRPSRRAGFTLLELMLVLVLIAIVMSVAIPSLLPAIAFSEHEGSARHLTNYGRALIAEAALGHEYLTFKIDLDNQEYWTVKALEETDELFSDEEEDAPEASEETPTLILPTEGGIGEMSAEDALAQEALLQEHIEQFVRMKMQAKARQVRHEEGILEGVGPNLDEVDIDLDFEEEEDDEEVGSDLLTRTRLPEGIVIDGVTVGDTEETEGIIEVEVTPLGLTEWVEFYVRQGEDNYYTVTWDAIAGNTRMKEGRTFDEEDEEETEGYE